MLVIQNSREKKGMKYYPHPQIGDSSKPCTNLHHKPRNRLWGEEIPKHIDTAGLLMEPRDTRPA